MNLPRTPDAPRRSPRASCTLIMLLNLAILLSNFAVSWGANETQTRVLRSTARLFHGVPHPYPTAGAAPVTPGDDACPPGTRTGIADGGGRRDAGPRARLARYLLRTPELERLSREQLGALCRSADSTSRALHDLGERLVAPRDDGLRTRAKLVASDRRLREAVARTLRGAAIPEGPMLDRLVRIVVASAG